MPRSEFGPLELGGVGLWPCPKFLEIPIGNLRVWESVEIKEILEILGSGEAWKVEILEIWPSKCPISSRVEI